ncbi:MAG: hypothetical protein RI973_2310, partial [Bacteroidota bacterium]
MKNYLLGDEVFSLARDVNGNMLMTSNNGLRIVHESDLNAFLCGEIEYLIPFYFGEQDGIYNPEFNGAFMNNYATPDSVDFYFPTVQGLVRYHSAKLAIQEQKVKLEQVLLDGIPSSDILNIPRNTRFIQFDFLNPVFNEFYNVHYQYKLVHENEENQSWSTPVKSKALTLSYLQPGKYVLYFRAIDAGNKPNPWVEKVEFYIIPYFYETVYFYLACILLFTGSIVYFIIRRNEQQQQKLRSEADIRNTISELQLSSIQSQMNPHFIFNSLNVLIQLIHSSNPTKAEEFAVAFSKLLRNVLEQSNHHFITVEQELANMRSYLSIQSERFQDQFDYSVTCEELLLSRDIPVMLVQPFVENAIIHGVAHASQKCRIDVHFREQSDGGMLVTVADDGIGRDMSFQINRGRRQQSLGTELVRRKILLLREKYNLHIR